MSSWERKQRRKLENPLPRERSRLVLTEEDLRKLLKGETATFFRGDAQIEVRLDDIGSERIADIAMEEAGFSVVGPEQLFPKLAEAKEKGLPEGMIEGDPSP